MILNADAVLRAARSRAWWRRPLLAVLAVATAALGLMAGPRPAAAGVPFTSGMVSITFDDNDLSQYTLAKPLLDAKGWKATFYVEAGKLRDNAPCCVTQNQFRQLATEGHELAAHTVNHGYLMTLADTDLADELADPITMLPQLTGAPTPKNFATPFGIYGPEVRSRVAAYYRSNRGISNGINFKDTNPYDLATVLLDRDRTMNSTKTAVDLTFVRTYLQQARDRNGWVILTFHDLANVLGPAGGVYQNQITTQAFTDILNLVQTLGLRVRTVDQALDEMGPKRVVGPGRVVYYDDVAESGYQNFTYGEYDFSNSERAHGGTTSIKIKPDFYASIQLLHPSVRAADYDALEFWINFGPNPTQRVFVDLRDYSGAPKPVNVRTLLGGAVPTANTWLKVRATALPTGNINIIRIGGDNDDGANLVQDPVWVDDIVLVPKPGVDVDPVPVKFPPSSKASNYVPLTTPTRIRDTRSATPLQPNGTLDVPVAGAAGTGVPANASAVLLNVTADRAAGGGFVQARPAGGVSGTSTLNIESAGQTIANAAIVRIGAGGAITFSGSVRTDLVVDVMGYFLPTANVAVDGRLTTVVPSRVFDTRSANTPANNANQTRTVPVLGRGGVPTQANQVSAVVLNVTAADATPGYVQVGPSDNFTAGAYSNINVSRQGQAIPNLVVVRPGSDGAVKIYTSQRAHLIVDVFGYFTGSASGSGSSGLFVPMDPVRRLDTRSGARPAANTTVSAALTLPAGVTQIQAVAGNVTLAATAGAGYVQVGTPGFVPGQWSNNNADRVDQTIPNAVIVPTGSAGQLALYTERGSHLIVDQSGVFTR